MSFFIDSFIRTFLAQQVFRVVEEEVTAQIQRELHSRLEASEQAAAIQSGRGGTDFAVIFSQHNEAVGLLDRQPDAAVTRGNGNTFYTFMQNGKRVAAAISSNCSREQIENVTHAVIDIFRPQRIINAGFAAGIAPGAALLSVYIPDLLIDAATHQTIDLRKPMLAAPQTNLQTNENITNKNTTTENTNNEKTTNEKTIPNNVDYETWFRAATLVTVKRPLLSVPQKKELRSAFSAQIADHSAFPIMDVCRKRLIPLLPLRIVTNVYDEELPRDIKQCSADAHHARRLGTFLGNFIRRPASVLDTVKQNQRQLEAADILAKRIAELIRNAEGFIRN